MTYLVYSLSWIIVLFAIVTLIILCTDNYLDFNRQELCQARRNISTKGPFSFRSGQAACHFPSISFVKLVNQTPLIIEFYCVFRPYHYQNLSKKEKYLKITCNCAIFLSKSAASPISFRVKLLQYK